jgi:hypothetical protein
MSVSIACIIWSKLSSEVMNVRCYDLTLRLMNAGRHGKTLGTSISSPKGGISKLNRELEQPRQNFPYFVFMSVEQEGEHCPHEP